MAAKLVAATVHLYAEPAKTESIEFGVVKPAVAKKVTGSTAAWFTVSLTKSEAEALLLGELEALELFARRLLGTSGNRLYVLYLAVETSAGAKYNLWTYTLGEDVGWEANSGLIVNILGREVAEPATPGTAEFVKSKETTTYIKVKLAVPKALKEELEAPEKHEGGLFGSLGIIGSISGHKVAKATLAQAEATLLTIGGHKAAVGSLAGHAAASGALAAIKHIPGALAASVGLSAAVAGRKTATGGKSQAVGAAVALAGNKAMSGSITQATGISGAAMGRKTAAGAVSQTVGLFGGVAANKVAGEEVKEGELLVQLGIAGAIAGHKVAAGTLRTTVAITKVFIAGHRSRSEVQSFVLRSIPPVTVVVIPADESAEVVRVAAPVPVVKRR